MSDRGKFGLGRRERSQPGGRNHGRAKEKGRPTEAAFRGSDADDLVVRSNEQARRSNGVIDWASSTFLRNPD